MEESFKARVDKVFGALADAQRPDSSLWALTDEEIERKEWNRANKTPADLEQEHLLVSSSRRVVLDEEEDEEDDAPGTSSRMTAKPDDHDEEEWMIRSSVGMDSTLDKEEEEDEFDQIAVGIDKAEDVINEYADCSEDDHVNGEKEAIVDADVRNGVVVPFSKSSDRVCGDGAGVKSILKKDERNGVKSLKRVRFDRESSSGLDLEEKDVDRSVRFASGAEVEGKVSFPPPGTDPRVPDYLRNPSKYTIYTLDSTSEIDEEVNKKAYMDFFTLIREKRAKEPLTDEDMSADFSKPITFMPRKKTVVDDNMDTSDSLKKTTQFKAGSSLVIAAADEVCAMDEDETEMTVVCSTIPRKTQRQYRAKAFLEPLDD